VAPLLALLQREIPAAPSHRRRGKDLRVDAKEFHEHLSKSLVTKSYVTVIDPYRLYRFTVVR
jgi:hypothetical protein